MNVRQSEDGLREMCMKEGQLLERQSNYTQPLPSQKLTQEMWNKGAMAAG